jgi:TolB-like protein/Tfp pilus assembly protein PilF
MLAKNPDDRYQTVHEVRTNLRELTGELTRSSEALTPTKKRSLRIPISLGIVLVAFVVLYWGWKALFEPSPAHDRKSIAVLPLKNLSAAPDSDYFSDGMTEDIITRLSKIGDLKVISRTSTMLYKDTDKNLRQIGKELDVATILEGSVRRADGQVRVVAQLIDAQTDEHIWAETYDRQLEDIFAIQTDVAEQIAAALETELSSEATFQIEKKPTDNLEAYNLYQQGRFIRWKPPENSEKVLGAVHYFLQATDKDPNFSLAYAALAECYNMLAWEEIVPWEKAERAVEKALELDSTLPEAHIARGQIRQILHFDWAGAESAQKRAIELDPNHWNAHREYGWLLARMGLYTDALEERELAYQLDPAGWISAANLGQSYGLIGDYDRAIETYLKLTELYPGKPAWHLRIGDAYAQKGLFDEALTQLDTVKEPDRNTAAYLSHAGFIHALMGDRAKAKEYIDRLESDQQRTAWSKSFLIARIHAGLRDYEKALKRIESINKPIQWLNLNTYDYLAPARSDPLYKELLRRINLEP